MSQMSQSSNRYHPRPGGVSRRSFLCSAGAGIAAAQSGQTAGPPMERAARILAVNDLDRRIWDDELDEFVPKRLYDMHGHLTRYELDLDPNKADSSRYNSPAGEFSRYGSLELLDATEKLLYPGREVTHMIAPSPPSRSVSIR